MRRLINKAAKLIGVPGSQGSPGKEANRVCAVYTMQLQDRKGIDGTAQCLSPIGRYWQPMINRTGDRAVFWGSDHKIEGEHLWLSNIDEQFSEQLTSGRSVNGHPSWHPDGESIVYFSSGESIPEAKWDSKHQFSLIQPSANLCMLNLGSRETKQITSGPSADHRPTFSPGGDTIVFVSNRNQSLNLWRVETDGSKLEQVTTGSQIHYRPAFSPDGKRLACFTFEQDGAHQIKVLSWPDCDVIPYPTEKTFSWMHGPFWSNNGRDLIFHGHPSNSSEQLLWTLNTESGSVTSVPLPGFKDASHASWNANETQIVFDSHALPDQLANVRSFRLRSKEA